jgi:hypothetical protein
MHTGKVAYWQSCLLGVRASVAVAHRIAGGAAAPAPPRMDDLAVRAASYALETRWPDAPFWARRRGRRATGP